MSTEKTAVYQKMAFLLQTQIREWTQERENLSRQFNEWQALSAAAEVKCAKLAAMLIEAETELARFTDASVKR